MKKENTKKEKVAKELTIIDIPGVGAATADRLMDNGFSGLLQVAMTSPKKLLDVAGVTESTARKMIKFARDSLDMGFESAIDVQERRLRIERISTGCKGFDQLLGGGFETGCISECFGQYGSGKTQIAHWLAVKAQELGDNVGIVYIDTENTFRPERIIEFANGLGLDSDTILKRIKVAKAYNTDHQMLLTEKVEDLLKDKSLNIKLIVVDSLTAHFRAEFIGRGTLADRQQKLNIHMHTLSRLANMYNVCVYVTNQVMTKPDQMFGDPIEAIGGHIVGHNSTFRIYLRRGKKGSRVAKLIDSPNLPDGEALYLVETNGLKDVGSEK